MARIGINGFGRIGRYLVRLMAERNEFPVVINARADNASLAHLFKYDSVHHTFKGTVGHDENGIIINGTHIAVTRCKPNEWQWKDYGVDLVVESTGTIKKRAGLAEHMACGAKKVIMSAPVSDADITIVMGVNDGLYDPAKHDVVSSASCTTNCLAPVAKVLNDTFGIEHGLMTTIHSYTMSQRILDGSQKDIRRESPERQLSALPRRRDQGHPGRAHGREPLGRELRTPRGPRRASLLVDRRFPQAGQRGRRYGHRPDGRQLGGCHAASGGSDGPGTARPLAGAVRRLVPILREIGYNRTINMCGGVAAAVFRCGSRLISPSQSQPQG